MGEGIILKRVCRLRTGALCLNWHIEYAPEPILGFLITYQGNGDASGGNGSGVGAQGLRLEQTQRPAEQQSQKWIDRQMGKVNAGLAAMSRGLAEKPWCNGGGYTLADIAVGCTLGYLDFRFGHIQWRDTHPNLARLYEKLSARPSFIETQPPQ